MVKSMNEACNFINHGEIELNTVDKSEERFPNIESTGAETW